MKMDTLLKDTLSADVAKLWNISSAQSDYTSPANSCHFLRHVILYIVKTCKVHLVTEVNVIGCESVVH